MDTIKQVFSRKTPEQKMKEYKRGLDKTARELDRERTKLLNSEKKLMVEMKKMAKADQIDSVKIMAKDLVRTRKYAQKFYRMKAQIQAVSLRLMTLTSTNQMAKAMQGVTKAMTHMNQQMNIPAMQQIMREFDRQNEMMGMKEEMMNDAIDDVMNEDGEEEDETEAEIQKVMDEVTLDFRAKVGVADAAIAKPEVQQSETQEDKALEDRLNALKTAMK